MKKPHKWYELWGARNGKQSLDASVTIRFMIRNFCNADDFLNREKFTDAVLKMIYEEGILGVADDKFHVVSVAPRRSKK